MPRDESQLPVTYEEAVASARRTVASTPTSWRASAIGWVVAGAVCTLLLIATWDLSTTDDRVAAALFTFVVLVCAYRAVHCGLRWRTARQETSATS